MCQEPVDSPHEGGRKLTASDLVVDLSLAIGHARFYGIRHRHVGDAIENTLLSIRDLLVASRNRPIEIGTADGYLFHEERPLLGTDRAAERLRPLLEALDAGGIAFGPDTEARDLEALLVLSLRRDLASLGLDEANRALQEAGARGTRLLGAYAIGRGPSDFAARTLGTKPKEGPRGASRHAVTVPERLYEGMFDHLTDVMMRIVRGDVFLLGETKAHIESMLRGLNDDATSLLDTTTRQTSRSDVFQFRHSIRVACLSLSIARALTDEYDLLLRIGAAALLHDVGKRFVSSAILHHDGKLTPEMFDEMKSHTVQGARWLMRIPDADPLATAVAFGHHRTLDQQGYPETLHDAVLSPATRIVKICDVYEALTAERPYKDPMPPRRAYRIMRDMGPHFDGPLFHRFIRVNGIWPLGARVRLESGAFARVVEQSEDLERPWVVVEGEADRLDLRDAERHAHGHILGLARPEEDDVGSLRARTTAS